MSLRYSYLEFGKKFIEGRGSSDYFELSYTNGYKNQLADYSRSMRASLRAPEFEDTPFRYTSDRSSDLLSAAFLGIDYTVAKNAMMLTLVQARRENELVPNSKMMRPFYQTRFQIASRSDLYQLFKDGACPLQMLFQAGLQRSGTAYRLKDYWQVENDQDSELFADEILAESKNCAICTQDRLFIVPQNIDEVANILAKAFFKNDKVEQTQVRVIGQISIDEKFRIVDSLQRLLRPVLKVTKVQNENDSFLVYEFMTFAFDYVTEMPVNILFFKDEDDERQTSRSNARTFVIKWGNNTEENKAATMPSSDDYCGWIKKGLVQRHISFDEANQAFFDNMFFDDRQNLKENFKEIGFRIFDLIGMSLYPSDEDYKTFSFRTITERMFILNGENGESFLSDLAKYVDFWEWFKNLLLREKNIEELSDLLANAVQKHYKNKPLTIDIQSPEFNIEKAKQVLHHTFGLRKNIAFFLFQIMVACPLLDSPTNTDKYLRDYLYG